MKAPGSGGRTTLGYSLSLCGQVSYGHLKMKLTVPLGALDQLFSFSPVRPLGIVSVTGVHSAVNPVAEVRGSDCHVTSFFSFHTLAASASSMAHILSVSSLPLHFPLLSSSTPNPLLTRGRYLSFLLPKSRLVSTGSCVLFSLCPPS